MILKTLNENGTMLDLIKLVKKNIEFYLKYRDELADIQFTNEELNNFIIQLNQVIELYNNNLVGEWFKNYNAYQFTSAKFPYIRPFMTFCFSFKDFIDALLMIGKTYHDSNGENYTLINIEYMDSNIIIPIFVNVKNGKIIKCEGFDKDKWYKKKNQIN